MMKFIDQKDSIPTLHVIQKLGDDWPKIQSGKRTIIHLPSMGMFHELLVIVVQTFSLTECPNKDSPGRFYAIFR